MKILGDFWETKNRNDYRNERFLVARYELIELLLFVIQLGLSHLQLY